MLKLARLPHIADEQGCSIDLTAYQAR